MEIEIIFQAFDKYGLPGLAVLFLYREYMKDKKQPSQAIPRELETELKELRKIVHDLQRLVTTHGVHIEHLLKRD